VVTPLEDVKRLLSEYIPDMPWYGRVKGQRKPSVPLTPVSVSKSVFTKDNVSQAVSNAFPYFVKLLQYRDTTEGFEADLSSGHGTLVLDYENLRIENEWYTDAYYGDKPDNPAELEQALLDKENWASA